MGKERKKKKDSDYLSGRDVNYGIISSLTKVELVIAKRG